MSDYLGRELAADARPDRAETLDRVVVCGAGPVGLTVALILARSGVPVTVLEKLDSLSAESRASTFHPSTLELLDEVGLAGRVVELGLRAPTTQFRDRTHGPVVTFDLGVLAGETAFPFRVQLEQSKYTVLVLEELRAGVVEGRYDVEVRFGHRVHRVEQADNAGSDSRAVSMLVGTSEELVELSAPWVIGAEGAHSSVRESVGITMLGETYPERFLVVSVAEELSDHLADLSYVNYVADPQEWLVLLRTPDHWRLLFPIPEHTADALDDSMVQAKLNGVVDLGRPWEVLASSLYVVARRVASRMRAGRVLLAGDAAHQNSPLGGMGMNSGIHDAVSLGRRLSRVWQGEDDSLLDEYERLRREVATEFVQADSHANWLALREPDPARRAELQDELRAVAEDPQLHLERMRRAAMLDAVRSSL
jgi:3-(3-hydroxy-phenyl)propionate hydroxylase